MSFEARTKQRPEIAIVNFCLKLTGTQPSQSLQFRNTIITLTASGIDHKRGFKRSIYRFEFRFDASCIIQLWRHDVCAIDIVVKT